MNNNENQSKAAGGHARAEVLTSEQRIEIAKKAATERWNPTLPKEEFTGLLKIGEREMPCAVLTDGTRVLSATGVSVAFGSRKKGRNTRNANTPLLPPFLATESIKPFIPEDLMTPLCNPIKYKPIRGGRTAYGYEATFLPKICGIILDADKAGLIRNKQMVEIAEILMRGFAEVGIIALVDEATGYQEVRHREALQAILDAYLRKELAAWAKKFPDEFYQQIYRLKNWPWKGRHHNPPQVVAHYTNDVVYLRLAPNILKELENRNPTDENGRRKVKHHQWLTDDIGNPALAQHLYAVLTLMRVSESWERFKQMLDVAHPKRGDTLMLPFMSGESSPNVL